MSGTEKKKCPKCGSEIPEGAPHGLCPRCLGTLNFETHTVSPEPVPGGDATAQSITLSELAQLFPQLEIIELLGKGGMGAVYKARQKQLDRVVALKILPPGVGEDPAFRERFAREARAMARLNHPGIVTLFEFGQTVATARLAEASKPTPPLYFLLMEYVDGVNLRDLLRGGRVSPREALAIIPQICDALQFAHDQGIIHRDIKPENVLVDRRGRVKIADFGIAKMLGAGESRLTEATAPKAASSSLTGTGRTVGTPAYMAPEQRERPEAVDHRADIYALGVVFYELLTGELPGENIPPPSRRVHLDVRLDEIVLHALEKSPERRYQQASEVKTAVNTVANVPAVPLQPPASAQPAPREVRVSSGGQGWNLAGYALAGILGFFLLLLIVGVGAVVASILLPAVSRQFKAEVVIPKEEAVAESVPLPSVSQESHAAVKPAAAFGAWEKLASAPIPGRGSACAVWTGKEMMVFGGEGMNVSFGDGAIYRPSAGWLPMPQHGAAPSARTTFTAVWTGSSLIVWGGFGGSYGNDVVHQDGAMYVPARGAWRPITTDNAPAPRFNHVAAWTGAEMIVWGGYQDSRSWYQGARADAELNSGGCFNPVENSWRATATKGAPSARFNHVGVWTGKEMIVWGGGNSKTDLGDGASYDPKEDAWEPLSQKNAPVPRRMPVAVWTGKEMILWGGGVMNGTKYFSDGGRYDPASDTWKPMSTKGAPEGSFFCQAVWTGRRMLVWGGVNDARATGLNDRNRYLGTGALYDPKTDSWESISMDGAPAPRLTHMVWTGDSALVFGGYNNRHLNDLYKLRVRP